MYRWDWALINRDQMFFIQPLDEIEQTDSEMREKMSPRGFFTERPTPGVAWLHFLEMINEQNLQLKREKTKKAI